MADEQGESVTEVLRPKAYRNPRRVSAGGRRYLDRCHLAGKTAHDFFDFLDRNYSKKVVSATKYFIRSGNSPNQAAREAMTSFLINTTHSVSITWFDFIDDHFATLNNFIQSNSEFAEPVTHFCGQFLRVFPKSPEGGATRNGERELAYGPLEIEPGSRGLLHWVQDKDDPEKPIITGFGLHDGNVAFLIGGNSSLVPRENIISYTILRMPTYSLRQHGVKFFGLQAGTLVGHANGIAVAKRTVLVTAEQWTNWGDGKSCPEAVKLWLFAEGSGISVDLVSEGRDYEAGAV